VISTVLGFCGSENEIDDYFDQFKGINFQLLSKRVDTDNYEDPLYQYFHSISESLDVYSVPVDNINIMPFFIEIKSGIVIPVTQKLETYSLELNRRENLEVHDNTKIAAIFDYWLQNSAQVMKGGYNTIYDILPSIGGIIQLIYYIFYIFNYLYNKYITIQDCKESFFRMYNSEDPKGVPMKKNFIRCVNSLREDAQKMFPKNKLVTAKKERRDSIFIAKYHRHKKSLKSDLGNNSIILNDENNKNNLSNSNDIIINIQNNLTKNTVTYNKRISVQKCSKFKSSNEEVSKIIEPEQKNNLADKFEVELREFIIKKNKTFKVEPFNYIIASKFTSLFSFFFYVIKYKKKSNIYFILNQFRLKLLGEEHLFKSNIILYHIEKYFNVREIQKVDILELYENL
jgi:hypothetical protein